MIAKAHLFVKGRKFSKQTVYPFWQIFGRLYISLFFVFNIDPQKSGGQYALRGKVILLYIYPQEMLCEHTHSKGDDSHAHADEGHFQKAALKGLVLSH